MSDTKPKYFALLLKLGPCYGASDAESVAGETIDDLKREAMPIIEEDSDFNYLQVFEKGNDREVAELKFENGAWRNFY